MEQFLIVCPLVFLAGFVDSIAGGGGLISFPAYMLAGVPVHVILGTSKLSAFPGSIVAALRFAKSGYIRFKLALPWAASAALGAVGGASLALKTDEKLIRSLMVVVLPVVPMETIQSVWPAICSSMSSSSLSKLISPFSLNGVTMATPAPSKIAICSSSKKEPTSAKTPAPKLHPSFSIILSSIQGIVNF